MSNKRNVTIMAVCTILVVIGVLLALMKQISKYESALTGISLAEAQNICDSQPGWFIVETSDGATGTLYLIAYGKSQGADVELTGRCPSSQLSNIFFLSRKNSFLVKGSEQNIQNIGIEFSEALPDIYTIEVDSWSIIVPIQRDYQYRTQNQKGRWFYPRNYIDEFDVTNGDYLPGG